MAQIRWTLEGGADSAPNFIIFPAMGPQGTHLAPKATSPPQELISSKESPFFMFEGWSPFWPKTANPPKELDMDPV